MRCYMEFEHTVLDLSDCRPSRFPYLIQGFLEREPDHQDKEGRVKLE